MRSNDEGELPWKIAVIVKDKLEPVGHDADKLHHLQVCHVALPPRVFLVLGSHGGQHVVEVHEHVHENVEQAEEGGVAARDVSGPGPHRHGHDAMVNHVQQGDLIELFSRHEAKLEME